MIAIFAALMLFQVDLASVREAPEEAARVAEQAGMDLAAAPWEDDAVVQETDAQALCRQARKMREQLTAIADRETAARVLLARHSNANGAPSDLAQVESLLADQDDLALGYMVASWSISRACKPD